MQGDVALVLNSTNMIFQIGKTYLMITIDSMMAMTHKKLITITREQNGRPIYKQKGKRKEYYCPQQPKDSVMYFDIQDANAILVDTDARYGVMRGNACFNFTFPEPDALRKLIEDKCLNKDEVRLDTCLFCSAKGEFDEGTETLLYPELETSHAVIRRIKDKALV